MPPVTFPSTIGLKFDWQYPEPPDVSYQLLQIEHYLEHPEVLAEEAKQALQYDMAYKFNTETDPQGQHWLELVEPSPFQQGILQLSGTMRDAAIDDASWIANANGVFFDPLHMSFGAPYWAYHEQPDAPAPHRIPQREFVGPTRQAEIAIGTLGEQWLARGMNVGGVFKREARAPSGIFIKIY